jgi:hypothetical protein
VLSLSWLSSIALLFATGPVAQAATNPMQAGARGRILRLPGSFLDPWLFDESSPPEAARPDIKAWAAGAEFTTEGPATQWTFYVERVGSQVEAGFWDDYESPADHNDGEWLAPSDGFGLITVGGNAGKEIAMTEESADVVLSFHVSGGLGIGFVTGQIDRWYAGNNLVSDIPIDTNCLPDSPSYERQASCSDDGKVRITPVVPMVDHNLGFDLTVREHAYLRLEGGLHSMLYGGIAAGGRW